MNSAPIPLQIGVQILLQVRSCQDRISSKFIGVEHGRYLILSVPLMSTSDLKAIFAQGKGVVGRYIHEGRVLGFETEVQGVIIQPANLIFLKYPSSVQDMNLRKHKRNECYLPAEISADDTQAHGVIIDISLGGCCLSTKHTAKLKKDSIAVDKKLKVQFALPGREGKLNIVSCIKNIRKDGHITMFGLQFCETPGEQTNQMHDFLNQITLISGST